MRTILLCLAILFLFNQLQAQHQNQEIQLENGQKFLIGKITTEQLKKESYGDWFNPNFKSYKVDENTVAKLSKDIQAYNILVFLGTWCGDSKREVPKFLKIIETANFPLSQLKMVALDRRKEQYKKSPSGEEWGLQILRVPTFIFYKNGREINRIIETPNTTLELDMLKIINGATYVPNKAKSHHFD